ncbi:MarR family transcriptional regulator [Microbacterium sp. BK668]|uniref:MarR family winged helix-turn-helix transcriptional regulator n=1 Tax=Microbacterium sp. BK668 TaxID=2512118 RepID=UPI00105C0541|nr:MarR family transcriptional regulator [Microbacterium sp. BK668]TDN91823.1 DNA-binding MarR family transcriptional regulator [Microbacterium sp. BK668]
MELTILDRLLFIGSLFDRDMNRAFEGTDLTPARMRALWVVHHSGAMTQQELARGLDITPRSVTALVDALEAAGYLERAPHPTDRRALLVSLTREGARLMERTVAEHAELSATLLDAVAPDDRAAVERGVEAMADRLSQLVAEAEVAASTDRAGS